MVELKGSRREFISTLAAGACGALAPALVSAKARPFALRYLVGSSLYGYMDLAEVVPQVRKSGAAALDIWPKVHGNQREQLDELGEEKFLSLLKENRITLGCITQYKLGPYHLREEMQLAKRLGCGTIITGSDGPKGLKGEDLKSAMKTFLHKMEPHIRLAEELGINIAIENHSGKLMDSEESVKWFLEYNFSKNIGLAFAPYHLPQEEKMLSDLIRLADKRLMVFYAWQHGAGSMQQQPREQEHLQLPGRGELDFKPLIQALKHIRFDGWTEIFMHAFPRGSAIMDTATGVTEQINFSRDYLEKCLKGA